MPYIALRTNQNIAQDQEKELKTLLGQYISLLPGKSEIYLMCSFTSSSLYFQGSDAPCAIIQVNIYGKGNKEAYDKFTKKVTELVSEKLTIHSNRVYVEYIETPYWGMDGKNF